MIESLDEVMSGQRVNLHGNVDLRMAMAADNVARLILHQDDDMIVLDAYQLAHLARVLNAMVKAGAT